MKRVFYVLHLSNRELQVHLDLMRLVCDPSVTSPAHLTVRGPYPNEQLADSIWKNARNIKIEVGGIGVFFSGAQSTVFLKCTSYELKRLWWKPDYKDFRPHITIYDGSSRQFARKLSQTLRTHDLSFEFVADRLYEHESANGQFSLGLDWSKFEPLLSEIGEPRLNKGRMLELSETERLSIVDRIARHLESVLRSENPTSQETPASVYAATTSSPRNPIEPARDRIFISHANPEDNEFARWLTLRLITEGYPVWCDLVRLKGGEDFWRDIEEAIRKRTAKFIYVLSKISNMKEGPLQELSVAKGIARQYGFRDFVIPLHIDDLPYNEMNIEMKRLTAIPFDSSWAKGLKVLLGKLEEDLMTKDPALSAGAAASWWSDEFSANAGVVAKQDTYLSSWYRIESLPKEIYFHLLSSERFSGTAEDSVEPAYPVSNFGSGVFSFAKRDDFQETLINGLLIPDSHRFNTQDLLEGKHSEILADSKQARNAVAGLLGEAWRRMIINRGLAIHNLANKSWCFYFVKDQVANDRLDFIGARGEVARRYIMGYRTIRTREEVRKLRHWHFGLSAKPIMYPALCFAVRGHVLFSDDGKQVWASPERLNRARISQCRNWWNDDWRDRILGTMSWLAKGRADIELPVGNGVVINVSKSPIRFSSDVSFIEPGEVNPYPIVESNDSVEPMEGDDETIRITAETI